MENSDVICISSDGGDSDDAVPRKHNNNEGIEISRIKLEKMDLTLNSEDVIIINDDSDFEEPNKEKDLTWIQTKMVKSSGSNLKPEPTWIRATNKSDSSGSSLQSSNGNHVKRDSFNQSLKMKEIQSVCNQEKSINNISDIQNGHTPEEVTNGFNNKDELAVCQSPIFNTGEVSILKRKAMPNNEISTDKMVTTPVKRIKLTEVSRIVPINNCASSPKPSSSKISTPLVSNESSSHSTNDRNSPTPGCSWHFEVEKPKLVIKKRKVLYDDEFDLFSTFIETCIKRDSSDDMKEIVKRLKKKHEKLHPTFLNSDRFKQLLIDKQQMISENEGKLFIHIQEVKDEMKRGEKRSHSLEKNARKAIDNCHEETAQNGDKGKKEEKKEHDLDKNEDKRKREKLNMILNSIEVCKKRIKQLEEEEVDLNDDEESSYLIVDKYKRKLMQLWNAYCKYSGEKVDAGRAFLRPKHISATLITQVDQAIMSFINSKISKRNELLAKGRSIADTVIFPDYADILNCISKCNSKYNLELSKLTMEIKAKEAFLKIGEHLQRVRQTDYWDTFSLYLEEEDDDPALKDPLLAEKLGKNYVEGKKKMADLLEVYTQKQESRAEQPNQNEDQDEDAEEAEEDNDEEEKEEDDDDDDDDSEAEVDVEDMEEKRDNETDDDDREMSSVIRTKDPHVSTPPVNNSSKENEFRDSPKSSTKGSSNALHDNPSKNSSFEAKDSLGDVDVIEVEDEGASKPNKQPLLRLRSFAKPPTSWDDSLQAEGSPIIRSSKIITLTPSPKITTSTPKPYDTKVTKVPSGSTFVDLTSEKGETQLKPGIRRVIDPSYVSTLKSKFKTVVVPSNFKGKQIISVKNITNNYNVVNAPGKSGLKSGSQTRIRIPGQSTSSISPRKPVQMRGNKVPEEAQRVVVDKNYVKNSQLLTKQVVRPVFYPSATKPKVFTNQEGQMVRLKSFVPNPEAKVMKVLKLNENRKVSITPLQKHSVVNKVLVNAKGSQSNNQLSPRKIQANSRIDHQYSKRIFNNVIRILKPGEQNYQNMHSDRPIKK